MKIAILGTRGVPNHHGGFEQFAENLSQYLVKNKHEVYVYNSHNHPYQESTWNGVHILHQNDPEHKVGTAGQFIYDLNCILDSRKRGFDAILQCGYTSSSVWGWLLPKKAVILSNMDGLEWKRSKYSPSVRKFLKVAEKWAIGSSDYLIADSLGIQKYLKETYNAEAKYIAYGAHLFKNPNSTILAKYGVTAYSYNMLVARLEPENNIEVILDGVVKSKQQEPFLVIGKHDTTFGFYLKDKFKKSNNIHFLGGIYDLEHLNNLRYYSNLYFHGHSVGGTNPSLLEAMASNSFIIAHDNMFNKAILKENAFYFSDAADVARLLIKKKSDFSTFVLANYKTIEEELSWDKINNTYEQYLEEVIAKKA